MLTKIEEIRLIAQCAISDNREAFGRLVEAYQPDIRRFFLHLTGGDTWLSDDLAQDTFIKAYTGIRGFRGLSKFRTWLYRIAYNEFYSHIRRLRPESADDPPDVADPGECRPDIDIDVEAALRTLTPAERAVVTLFYIEDRPIKEVAAIMGMPEGTVKSHISRARPKLTEFLGNNR